MIWLAFLVVCVCLLYTWFTTPDRRFRNHNVPFISRRRGFKIFYNLIFREANAIELVRDQYDSFPDCRYYGMFQLFLPAIIIRDPKLAKQIAIKDFDHFVDRRGLGTSGEDDILSKNLFNMKGAPWKEMRATLSPAFTSKKMRGMYQFINDCARNFVGFFDEKEEDLIEVDVKDIFGMFASDVIASVSFGIQCDSLKNSKNEFYTMGKELTSQSKFTLFKFVINVTLPFISKLFKIELFPKKVVDFFQSIILETIKTREEKHIIRPDMIHLLMEAKKGRLTHEENIDADAGFATVEESHLGRTGKKKQVITDKDICGEALIFFFAGFEPTSRGMSFIAMELCKNPDIQRKLLEEVDEVFERTGGDVTYEDVVTMKYLDQVITETFRMWPPVPQVERVCTKDYLLEPEKPHEMPYLVKKGDWLVFNVGGIHYDPEYYPNPDTFDPDRFSDKNKGNIQPGTYLPFGIGPRNCIGSRFALMEIKVLLFHLLSKFELCFSEKTLLPLQMITTSFNVIPKGGFQFGLKRRKGRQNAE